MCVCVCVGTTHAGNLKCCYNLQTLVNIANARTPPMFMQPPHFRAPMEAELRQRIFRDFPGVLAQQQQQAMEDAHGRDDDVDVLEEMMLAAYACL